MGIIAPYRYELDSTFGSDKYIYGDLYGFSYLRDYKIKLEKKNIHHFDNKERKINLYAVCDSYLWSFAKTDSIFDNVNNYKYVRLGYNEQIEEKLDPAYTNILLIEATERQVRKYLADTTELYYSMRVSKDNPASLPKRTKGSLWNRINSYLFNDEINQNLEFNLFDYRFLTSLKESKASLFFNLCGRINSDVMVSSNKKYLFYGPTTDNHSKTSSFSYLSDGETENIINNLNAVYSHFRKLGFDEIYLSIIPNPVTILEPAYGNYNHLIDRIQSSPNLKVPVIDVYPLFKQATTEIYYRSDTHWNYNGFEIWVNETNNTLRDFLNDKNKQLSRSYIRN